MDIIEALYSLVWNYGAGRIISIDLSKQIVITQLQYGQKRYRFFVEVKKDGKVITVYMCKHKLLVR